jgi:hypothetical protein
MNALRSLEPSKAAGIERDPVAPHLVFFPPQPPHTIYITMYQALHKHFTYIPSTTWPFRVILRWYRKITLT